MVNIFKPKNLFKNMKGNYQTVVITCKYHNGRNGYHDPYSSRETIIAVGEGNKEYLSIKKYTQLFVNHNGNCITCPYAKIYFLDGENRKERNGKVKINIKIKIEGELTNYEEIIEKARELGFPYL
jgi:hypothetical protein